MVHNKTHEIIIFLEKEYAMNACIKNVAQMSHIFYNAQQSPERNRIRKLQI